MDNFIFNVPSIAYFGKGQIELLGETMAEKAVEKGNLGILAVIGKDEPFNSCAMQFSLI